MNSKDFLFRRMGGQAFVNLVDGKAKPFLQGLCKRIDLLGASSSGTIHIEGITDYDFMNFSFLDHCSQLLIPLLEINTVYGLER